MSIPVCIILSSLFSQQPAGQMQPTDADLRRSAELAQVRAGGFPVDASIGPWLVDLARHQGHAAGRADARGNALHVLALLRAAARVSPECADAHKWLYDIELRMDRPARAREALEAYVRDRPDDDTAAIHLLQMRMEDAQTTEARAKIAETELKRRNLSRSYESELHLWLARHYYERNSHDEALQQVQKALLLNPMNVEARELAYTVFGETQPDLQRVEMALQLISANPSQANLIWDLAEFLDGLGMHRRAQEWFNRAIEIHAKSNANEIPAEYWHRIAVSYFISGETAACIEAIDRAIAIDPDDYSSHWLRAVALRKSGKAEEADKAIEGITQRCRDRIETVKKEKIYDEAAEIAIALSLIAKDKQIAMEMAEFARSQTPPMPLAQTAQGYALAANGRHDEARKVLQPLAEDDLLAAAELAHVQTLMGDREAAAKIIKAASEQSPTGIAEVILTQRAAEAGIDIPSPVADAKIIAALDKFRRDVFDYYDRPADFLRFTIKPASNVLEPMAPIRATFRLENIGPFPITFGDGYMTRPLIAVTAQLGGEAGPNFENYLTVLMSAHPVLLPGDAYEETIALDIGDVRTHLIEHVDRPMPIKITALLDPIWTSGALQAGLGTIAAGPFNVVRSPLDISPKGIETLAKQAEGPDVLARSTAAERIGALIATNRKRPEGERLPAAAIDRLNDALSKLVADSSWQVQSHALVAAGWAQMDQRVTIAASPQVRSSQPIVRLLAVRLFAEEHGSKFREVLEQLSASDEDESVRLMAASFLPGAAQAGLTTDSPVKTTVGH